MSRASRRKLFGSLVSLLLCCASGAFAQRIRDFHVPLPAPRGSVLVIGFLGGLEHWNDPHRGVRKVVLDLRSRNLPGVYAESVENHRQEIALELIKRAVGSSTDGERVRIVLYGQSWGGAAVVATARDLEALRIPVDLTVQVDSVGWHDDVIPENVRAAANIFQHDPFTIQGRTVIRAEDPQKTRILENTRYYYLFRPYATLSVADGSWARRTFGGSHAKMELDETVWKHVEQLILDAIGE